MPRSSTRIHAVVVVFPCCGGHFCGFTWSQIGLRFLKESCVILTECGV